MKKLAWWAIMALLLVPRLAAQLHPDYENPAVFERGQVPPHATLMPYENLAQALEGERKSSPCHLTLNGIWKFHWAENPGTAPSGFFEEKYQRGEWSEIRVPSNWQMEGFGYPLFRNIGLPHPLKPPEVPDDFNPVGSYYRTFIFPGEWEGKQVFLHFEGVQSASYVWINAKEVGYNEGAMEPAEYDITPYLKKGENSIAVQVLRYCDGTYLEDQDTWRLSGIYRDVYLMATPKTHIRDFYVTTELDENYRDALLRVEADVVEYGKGKIKNCAVRASLYDGSGIPVKESAVTLPVDEPAGGPGKRLEGSFGVKDPLKWSAEYPDLYTLVLELVDGEGEVLEFLSSRVGFREVEVRDQVIWINGRAIKFNGVNSHMIHPETGHTMDVATMEKDLSLMKQFNINCVRTSHYPPNIAYLDLADKLGVYIIDETGDEAHAYMYLSEMPEWREAYLDRARQMVYRDRNHPSVVMWSAGNETGWGENICALIQEGIRIDPSRRAWMYGGNDDEDPKSNPILCEPVVGPRYLEPFRLEHRFAKSDDPQPSFMDEYIAATGNSLGGLDEYWELIRQYPRLTGGAIWDWPSPGITMPVVTTRDDSPGDIRCVFMNRAHLVEGESGQALYLSGHDDWLEIYRDPSLDIEGEQLTISFHVKPEVFNGNAAFLTKGDYQFGIIQKDGAHLEFYLNNGQRVSLTGKVPGDWTGRWHHVAGIYDGRKMELYVDGSLVGTHACRGAILNSPYPVTLGKSAELRDSHMGNMCHATLDQVRIFDQVLSMEELQQEQGSQKERSKLWLDFETSATQGKYWSIGIPGRTYGLVWPDRSVQPELWQLKKSPQPVQFAAVDLLSGRIRVENWHHFRNLEEFAFEWTVTEDGKALQEGTLEVSLPAGDTGYITIPFSMPDARPGSLYHLLVSCKTKTNQPWAKAGHEVAWEQFELPIRVAVVPLAHPEVIPEVEETVDRLIIRGDGFSYTFDRNTGTLSSMVIGGKELVGKGLRFNVWHAPLANELDSWNFWHTDMGYTKEWMGKETANGWRSIGLDRLVQELDRLTRTESDGMVTVTVEASLHASNHTTGFKVHYIYTIYGDGQLSLTTRAIPSGYLTRWIPKMGLKMELPDSFCNLEWLGRGPFETYPDRKTGAKIGHYRTTADEDFVPYIIPQEYGNKTDVSWLKVTDEEGTGIFVSGEVPFNASLQKYTTGHLDRCHYPFQLKDEGVVTLNIDHRVSGVGCTAMSVLNPYQVTPEETTFTFNIKPVL